MHTHILHVTNESIHTCNECDIYVCAVNRGIKPMYVWLVGDVAQIECSDTSYVLAGIRSSHLFISGYTAG